MAAPRRIVVPYQYMLAIGCFRSFLGPFALVVPFLGASALRAPSSFAPFWHGTRPSATAASVASLPSLPCPVAHRHLRAFPSFLLMPQRPARLAPRAACSRPEAALRHLHRSFPHPHVLSLSLFRQPRPRLLRANPRCHSSSLPPLSLSGPAWAARRRGLPLALSSIKH